MSTNAKGHTRIGHLFSDEIYDVFLNEKNQQYIVIPEEKSELCGTFLPESQTWFDRFPDRPSCEPELYHRAVHEIGHAVACFLAGIKVEYVTIQPFYSGSIRLNGICKYDHDLESYRRVDPDVWNKRLAMAHLGGPIAERMYLALGGLPVKNEHQFGWAVDEDRVTSCLEKLTPDVDDQARRREAAKRILEEQIKTLWPELEKAASLLLTKGAISGKMARECFGNIQSIDLSLLD